MDIVINFTLIDVFSADAKRLHEIIEQIEKDNKNTPFEYLVDRCHFCQLIEIKRGSL